MTESRKKATYLGVDILSDVECRDIVARKLKAEEVEVVEVKTATLSEKPSGFLGDHFRVNIIARAKENELIEINLFVKCIPRNSVNSEYASIIGSYKKETHFFSVLMNDLMKYNGDSQEVEAIQPTWSCECYLTTPSKIVLEDLFLKSFKTHSHILPMDKEHCMLVVQTLARFHASSIIFEEKKTQRTGVACRLNEVYPDQFVETDWVNEKNHPSQGLYRAGMNALSALFKNLPGVMEVEGRHEDLVERMWASYGDICSTMAKPSREFRNVVSHGDLWFNNIFIRYDVTNKPVEAKFVDFQQLRYTPPAHDFITFLHLTTRRQLREQHLLDLARAYHDTLRAELTRHHLDVDSILPWDQFEASLAQYREMAVFTACIYFPIVNMDLDVMAGVMKFPEKCQRFMFEDRTQETCRYFETDSTFKALATESMQEFIGLLTLRDSLRGLYNHP